MTAERIRIPADRPDRGSRAARHWLRGSLACALIGAVALGAPLPGLASASSQDVPQVKRPPIDPRARLTVDARATSHDFGLIAQGTELTHTFLLASAGTAPVVISEVRPTCGCVVSQLAVRATGASEFAPYTLGEPIAPSAEVRLQAVLRTGAKLDQTHVEIDVVSNASAAPVQLQLRANVEPFLRATPPFLQFGDVPGREGHAGRIDVRTTRGQRVLLTVDGAGKVPLPEGFSYELTPVAPDEDGRSNHWQVAVRLAAGAPEGPRGFAFTFISDLERAQGPDSEELIARNAAIGRSTAPLRFYSVNANVSYRVLGPLSVSPEYVSFGVVRAAHPYTKGVRLLAQDPDLDLSHVEVALRGQYDQPLRWAERFSTLVRPVDGANAVDVLLSLSAIPEGETGPFRGELVIRSGPADATTTKEFVVRFTGVCQ